MARLLRFSPSFSSIPRWISLRSFAAFTTTTEIESRRRIEFLEAKFQKEWKIEDKSAQRRKEQRACPKASNVTFNPCQYAHRNPTLLKHNRPVNPL